MTLRCIPIILSALLACSPSLAQPLQAPVLLAAPVVLRPEGADWSLTIPHGWHSAPEFLEKMKEALVVRQINQTDFIFALLPDDNRPIYAIIQRLSAPPAGSTYEDIEKSLGAGSALAQSKSEESLRDAFSTLEFAKPLLDRIKNRILIKVKTVDPHGVETLGFSEGSIGKSSIIMIHCYAPPALAEASMPDFRAIWNGFRFDPDRSFTPPFDAPSNSGRNVALLAAFVGVAAALGFAFTRKLFQNKASARP